MESGDGTTGGVVVKKGDVIRVVEKVKKGAGHGFYFLWVPAFTEVMCFSNELPPETHDKVQLGAVLKVTRVSNGRPTDFEEINFE